MSTDPCSRPSLAAAPAPDCKLLLPRRPSQPGVNGWRTRFSLSTSTPTQRSPCSTRRPEFATRTSTSSSMKPTRATNTTFLRPLTRIPWWPPAYRPRPGVWSRLIRCVAASPCTSKKRSPRVCAPTAEGGVAIQPRFPYACWSRSTRTRNDLTSTWSWRITPPTIDYVSTFLCHFTPVSPLPTRPFTSQAVRSPVRIEKTGRAALDVAGGVRLDAAG